MNYYSGDLLIDTSKGIITHSSGDTFYGLIEDKSYRHVDGTLWSYSVCKFTFEEIKLGGSLVIELIGNSALMIEAASGDFILGADLYANGGNSDTIRGRGGLGILGDMTGLLLVCFPALAQAVPPKPPSMATEQVMAVTVQEVPMFMEHPKLVI